jgi:hypothetical protein
MSSFTLGWKLSHGVDPDNFEQAAAFLRRRNYWDYYSGGPALGLMTRNDESQEP